MDPTETESSIIIKPKSLKSKSLKSKSLKSKSLKTKSKKDKSIKDKTRKDKTRKDKTRKKYRKYDNMTIDTLKSQYEKYIKDLDIEDNELEYNNFLRNKERLEQEDITKNNDKIINDTDELIDSSVLYPSLNDKKFNEKITLKKEFLDTKQDLEIKPVEEQGDVLCNSEFELAPHQMFVRNFLSFQTPYNGLLLFHGLGTGKTCSAISVCEEMRDYMKQTGITRKIVIVASPNVQQNFRLQLFDERKLKQINGLWNIRACTGNKFLKEINPMNMRGLKREKIIKQIKRLIKESYSFMGYTEFSNFIAKTVEKYNDIENKSERKIKQNRAIRREFSNRLIVIDEVHNIRISDDSPNKKTAQNLLTLVKNSDNLRLLLLSATPMFNNYTEIIWLINLLNINDNRSTIQIRDIFDSNGNFKLNSEGEEVGKELFIRKITGYISYLSGENPYTFPYRIFPKLFAESSNILSSYLYPRFQINGSPIIQDIQHLDIFTTVIGKYQQLGYTYIIENLKDRIPKKDDIESGLGYQMLDTPLQALNMIYPIKDINEDTFMPVLSRTDTVQVQQPDETEMQELDETEMPEPDETEMQQLDETEMQQSDETEMQDFEISDLSIGGTKTPKFQEPSEKINIDIKYLVGKIGLSRSMYYNEKRKNEFQYKETTEENFGKIFSPSELPKYSSKISSICENIKSSNGISLIYSQFIDGGCVPVALALEEMGFTRYKGSKRGSLFKKLPTEPIDAISMKPQSEHGDNFQPASYVMITGDKILSPNNVIDLKAVTNENNFDGSKVKVVIISKAGSEGLDFVNLRQVHILEPWYNMNRIEQIIGRAVRFCSHKQLEFSQRNVEIYLHGTILDGTEEESADLYVYRLAENKSVKIGNVTRVLKENAVDCVLNDKLNMLTEETMSQTVLLNLPSGKQIQYNVGYKPYSSICDYMESCSYKCQPEIVVNEENISNSSYHEDFINVNIEKVMLRIRNLFKERYVYTKNDLIQNINAVKQYPLSQIFAALDKMVSDKTEFVTDIIGRNGNIINIGEYYMFQPTEIEDTKLTQFERSVPIDFKRDVVKLPVPTSFSLQDDASRFIEKQTRQKSLSETISDKKLTPLEKEISDEESLAKIETLAKRYIKEIEENLQTSLEPYTTIRGDNNWYRYVSLTRERMEENDEVSKNIFLELLIDHVFDSLPFHKKFVIVSYLYQNESDNQLIMSLRKKVFQDIIKSNDIDGYVFIKGGKAELFVFRDLKFVKAETEDLKDFTKKLRKLQINKDKLNDTIGFFATFNSDFMVFKTKSRTSKGTKCDQSGKATVIKLLNKIFDDDTRYTKEKLNRNNNIIQLCTEQEMYLRYFDKIKKDDKRWFLKPSEYILSYIK